MIKGYLRKSDVTKLLKKLGSNVSYEGTEFTFEGCNKKGNTIQGEVSIGGTVKNPVYLIEYKEVI